MRIRRLQIENFGKLQNFELELQEGWNLICAENGWGKSTLAAFIKAMFYGLVYTTKRSLKENERKKYAPWQGGAFGGSLEFETGGKAYRVERFFGAKDKEDSFALFSLDTGLESRDYSERLGEELFHLDRTAFERSSYFAQKDFAASLNDSLNARLTRVEEAAGDMQNYEKAAASLENRMKYFLKTGGRGRLGELDAQRRRISGELAGCRGKEAAAVEWRQRLQEKTQELQALQEKEQELELRIQELQAYEGKAARKEQYDRLRQEAAQKEARAGKLRAELEEFVCPPLAETELDRCRERIFRLQGLELQTDGAGEELERAEQEKERAQEAASAISSNFPVYWIAAGLLAAGGAAFCLMGWYLVGAFLLLAGAVLGMAGFQQKSRRDDRKKEAEDRLLEAEKRWKCAQEACRRLEVERRDLHGRICRILSISEKTGVSELEACWKAERQRSQKYVLLKRDHAVQSREAESSREAFLNYRKTISPEELAEFPELKKPEQESEELRSSLQLIRSSREGLLKEQRSAEHQLAMLLEAAERIPELEEEEERTAQELENAQEQHALLEKTLKYLKTAREQFSTRYLKQLQQSFLRYMEELEPERCPEALLDVKLKVRIREAGVSRDLEAMSAGWQDLIQIAERLAIVDALYEEEQPVLIFDDPFVNLDDGKRGRAIELLQKMSQSRQLIYFTCRG